MNEAWTPDSDTHSLTITRQELKEILQEVLYEHHLGIDPDIHRDEHEYLRMKIRQDKRRAERWKYVQNSAIGAITVGMVTGIFSLLYWIGSHVIRLLGIQQ